MKTHSKPVHPFEVFDRRAIAFEGPTAIATRIAELALYCLSIFWIVYGQAERGRDASTNIMQQHAYQLVCNVRLGAGRGPT